MVIYLIGTLLVVAGLAYGADRLGVGQVWIVAGALVIIGLGLMGGIVKTRSGRSGVVASWIRRRDERRPAPDSG